MGADGELGALAADDIGRLLADADRDLSTQGNGPVVKLSDALLFEALSGAPATCTFSRSRHLMAVEHLGASWTPVELVFGDIDGDGVVAVADLVELALEGGSCEGCCLSDLDLNGVVDVTDLVRLIANWSA